jgi:hypothetical protein
MMLILPLPKHKLGLPIVGHVPDKVRLKEVVEAGRRALST